AMSRRSHPRVDLTGSASQRFAQHLLGVAVHGVAELLEALQDVVDRLVVVDLEIGVADAFQVEGTPLGGVAGRARLGGAALALPAALEGVLALAVAGDQAA